MADARVISGPEELRKAALQSALQWHFAHEAAGNKRQVTIAFQLPEGQAAEAPIRAAKPPPSGCHRKASANKATVAQTRTVKSINVVGLSDEARTELLSRLPARVGATITPELLETTRRPCMTSTST